MIRLYAICASLAILTACATSTEQKPRGFAAFEDDPRLGEQVDKICYAGRIDGFNGATRDTVVLRAGVKKEYRVSVRGACPHLRQAFSIGLAARTSCLTRRDYLVVSDTGGSGFQPQRCYIDEIYRWDRSAKRPETDSETQGETEGQTAATP